MPLLYISKFHTNPQRISMKIREAMFDKDHRELLTGVVEVEETYIGGKPGNKVVSHEVVGQKKLLLWEWRNVEGF
ncbi:hypothetical protein LCGC14_2750530 [marine sediment metagenome]|uniref:Uncharacterized protein n=1 Tax=marine sediment metagenome TaxID=412755 RepID=A0A0F8Z236_9ZZZZ|nr:hypothetical protein [Candidatus Scalindua sediminis]